MHYGGRYICSDCTLLTNSGKRANSILGGDKLITPESSIVRFRQVIDRTQLSVVLYTTLLDLYLETSRGPPFHYVNVATSITLPCAVATTLVPETEVH